MLRLEMHAPAKDNESVSEGYLREHREEDDRKKRTSKMTMYQMGLEKRTPPGVWL